MKLGHFFLSALLFACSNEPKTNMDSLWKDSLIAENKKLIRERDSLEKMLGLDCFMGALISFKNDYALKDTIKFQFFPAYGKPGIADYFHYTVVDHDPYRGGDMNDIRPLDSLEYHDSIPINTEPIGTDLRNLIKIIDCKKGNHFLVGYFTRYYKNKIPTRFYSTARFTVK